MKLRKRDTPQLALTQMPYSKKLQEVKISMHCWQGDDVHGFWNADGELTGGILSTETILGLQELQRNYAKISRKHTH